jgi:hypothetical protein
MENLDEKQFSVELDFMTRSVIEMGFSSIKDIIEVNKLVDGKVMNTLSQEDKNEMIEWLEQDALPFYESQNMIDKKEEVLNLLKEIK